MSRGFLIVMVVYGVAVGGVASKALLGDLGGLLIAVPVSVLLVLLYRRLAEKGIVPRTPQQPARRSPGR